MGKRELLGKLVRELDFEIDGVARKALTEDEQREREYRKFVFVKFFNSTEGKIVLDILDSIVKRDTNFDNPNVNYYRDGQLSILNYIRKNAKVGPEEGGVE